MKNKIYIKLVAVTLLFLTACNSLDDLGPTFRLEEDKAITNAGSAESVLAGVYVQLRPFQFIYYHNIIHARMGITYGVPFWAAPNDLDKNTPFTNNSSIQGYYAGLYKIIQEANLFIENVSKVEASKLGGDAAKNNFIGEARFLRAFAHFNLLRGFGYHFDTNSEFGVALRKEAARGPEPLPRNTVAETYAFIYEDLDYAIANCTASVGYKGNKQAALGLKAKAKLYEGDFAAAATLAKQLIDNPGSRALIADYKDNFSKYNANSQTATNAAESRELLFGPYGNAQERVSLGARTNGSIYQGLAGADPRAGVNKGFAFLSFSPRVTALNTLIFLRMAEVYLIHAEATARATNSVDAAGLASLNAVRARVGLAAAAPANVTAFLEAIRLEKLLELYAEQGEEFFDLVRYEKLGNITASTVKPSMTNANFYVLPIPDSETQIEAYKGIVKQNPGY